MHSDIFSHTKRRIRRTMAPQFSPTQSMSISNSIQTNSSFLFNTVSTISTHLFDQNSDRIEIHTKKTLRRTYVRYAPRFLKDKIDVKKFHAKREVDKKIKREEFRKNRIKQRDANVYLYRSYQVGDFPDIVIPISNILLPLQFLAKRDNTIARNIYVMLFNNLVEKLPKEQSMQFLQQVYKNIIKIFEETTTYIPDLIGTFFDIFLRYKENMKIHPELLFTLTKNSGLLSHGTLLLENQIRLFDEDSDSSKKGCASVNMLDLYWVKLADIYKELKLWDGVTGIFTDKMAFSKEEVIISAIKNESNGLWKNAAESYNDLLITDTSNVRNNSYCDSILKCYANLGEWTSISEYVEQKLGLEKIWDAAYYQENLLPWFFSAGVHITLQTQSNTCLLNSLEIWMNDEIKSKYIKDNFSEELSIICLLQNELKDSKYFLEKCFLNFLDDYSSLNPLFKEVQTEKLLNLQKTIEIHKYLEATSDINEVNFKKRLNPLCYFWEKQNNLQTNIFLISEIKFVYRKFALDKIKNKISDLLLEEEQGDIAKKLDKLSQKCDLNFISYALRSKNYNAAKKLIAELYEKKKGLPARNEEDLKLIFAKASSVLLKSEQKALNVTDYQSELNKLIQIDANKNLSADIMMENANLIFKFYNKIYEDILKKGGSTASDYNLENVKENCINFLKKGIDIGESENKTHILGESYMTLVAFLKKIDTQGSYNEDIIKFVLRSMKLGHKKAGQMFSYILRLLEKNNSYKNLFVTETESVPCWMFIPWIPQLLANLDTDCGQSVSNILIEIAKSYQQAIMYPYHLRKEKLTTNKEIIKKLDDLLFKDSKIELFIKAISCIYIPEKQFQNHLRELVNAIDNEDKFSKLLDIFKSDFCTLVNNSSRSINSLSGIVFEPYNRVCQQILEIITNKNFNNDDLKKELSKFSKIDITIGQNYRNKLESYSPWLANFQNNNEDFLFEIPGQYKGNQKPLTQYHAVISSFKKEVHVFGSIRAPLKIIMLGNDAKEYEFLVKYGEDLRQDERIQQLCSLANDILQNDQQCSQRNLSIQTYNVTPLTSQTGLIEFVKETNELNNYVSYDKKTQDKIISEYISWIRRAQKHKIDGYYGNTYHLINACMAYKRDEVISKYKDFASRLPFDSLSKAFWSISRDVESFTSLRYQFITSYSTMCIIHWLLGIGDRHLHNTLVCQKTGRVIGIDFYYAFDTGVRNSPYPELLPFRLTPQILNLIEPFREHGFVKLTMTHALRAFRKEKDILLSAMDVFINEPTLSWLEAAQSKVMEENGLISTDFIPREKLANAESKFNGCNPIKITQYELSQRSGSKDVFEALSRITKGDKQFNIRSRLPLDGLTEENQVLCLLDQATDENILGRCYWGFEPWV